MSKKRVLVQAGHIAPREPGFESGTGTVREQELTRKLRDKLVKLLKDDGRFEPLPAPGDIPNGIKADAALFLHGDGSGNPASSGYSFGYPDYAVNKKLARLIDREFQKLPGHPPHHADNYTRDLAGYYGFSRVDTPGPEVLVEHGFLTNPHEQAWIFSHLDELAAAEYQALLLFFGLPAAGKKRGELGDAFYAWAGWKLLGGVKALRPKSLPTRIPKAWWDRLKQRKS